MATFQGIKSSVYAVLRDSEKAFIEESTVNDWVNEAYLDINARLRLLRKQTTGTTSATGTISLPSDFIEATWLSVLANTADTNQTVVEFTDDETFDSWKLTSGTGIPNNQLARIFGGTIETYPAADSVAYTLRYVYKPTALAANGDTPAIPEELHVRLINYARAHAKYQEGELDEGDRYLSLYSSGLPGAPTGVRREKPGPFQLRPAPNWYDA